MVKNQPIIYLTWRNQTMKKLIREVTLENETDYIEPHTDKQGI